MSEPGAALTIHRSEGGGLVKDAPMQNFQIVDNDQCENVQKLAGFSFDRDYAATRRIAAGKPISFLAHSAESYTGGDLGFGPIVAFNYCWSLATFTPVDGRSYVMRHIGDPARPDSCTFVVVDETTGEAPADLEIRQQFACPDK
ncbi:hypothetical protein GCM10011342_25780 [Aquisalinus flavus]|uniref:Uncharacterized protein n=2 Tax=Aquisalinus flavus TaxID=1526572 RepID=A0A8J2V6N3_9PROT|nr:hypothetical protein GCM10011342_25780 [Aquisalinus flavus]